MKAVRGETDTRCPCVFAKQPIMVKANPEIIDPPPLLCWGLHRIDIPWPDFESFNTALRLAARDRRMGCTILEPNNFVFCEMALELESSSN